MSLSKIDRLKLLMGENFVEPSNGVQHKPKYIPALTDEELRAAAPDSMRSPNAPLDFSSLDVFHGSAYNNPNLELVGISDSDHETDLAEGLTGVSLTKEKPHVKAPKRSKQSTASKNANISNEDNIRKTPQSDKSDEASRAGDLSEDTGRLAELAQTFCPIVTFSKFPYKYMRAEYSELVAERFWNAGKFWEREWNVFYVWPPPELSEKPLLLIPLEEAQQLLDQVNEALPESNTTFPSGGREIGLLLAFEMYPLLRPRYLGRSSDRTRYNFLEQNVPARSFKPRDEPKMTPEQEERSLEAFKTMMELAMNATKAKNKTTKAKKKEERVVKQQSIGGQLKRVERYLGLRPKRQHLHPYDDPKVSWEQSQEAERINDEDARMQPINAEEVAPYPFEHWVIFICVDVEAYERANHMITEVGLSTLDTWELKETAPGKNSSNWETKIRKRHFRIKEHSHLVNNEFVNGCPDKFEFGDSEFISKHDAPQVIASCFKHPFSGSSETPTEVKEMQNAGIDVHKRNIVFVGHNVTHDIEYLQKLGYNPLNLDNLVEYVDTAQMHRYLKRAQQPASLGSILYDFDMTGWNLHNAGNDAAYTLHAMLAIAVRHCEMRGSAKAKEEFTEAFKKREEQLLGEARERAREEQEGWDSAEDDDGGVPVERGETNASARIPKKSNARKVDPAER